MIILTKGHAWIGTLQRWITRQGSPGCIHPIRGLESQTSYPKFQWKNTLDKRGEKEGEVTRSREQEQRGTQGHRAGARAYEIPMLQEASRQA